MKTEKEIRDRIELHKQSLTVLNNELSKESGKLFINKGVISQLKDQMDMLNRIIALLSWVLSNF